MPSTSTSISTEVPRIALIGNPNVGKSTVFNLLTGASVKIGNYPGITIGRKSGLIRAGNRRALLVDLPGLYSLESPSPEMQVALTEIMDPVSGKKPDNAPDTLICLLDATNIQRSLLLYAQCLSLGYTVLPVATMADAVGSEIDWDAMSAIVGRKILPLNARDQSARPALLDFIWTETVKPAAPGWLAEFTGCPNIAAQKTFITQLCAQKAPAAYRPKLTERIDKFMLRPGLGLGIFSGVLLLLFQAIFTWAAPVMDLIGDGIGALAETTAAWLGEGWFVDLLTGGIITGVGNAVVFVPQIAFLFLFIAILEDTGIMARGAYTLNFFMRKAGLSGKAVVPLLSSNACAIPGIMATRTIKDPKERMAVIFIAPFMTCSARLPVYAFLIAAFIPAVSFLPVSIAGFEFSIFNSQGMTLAALYFLGTFTALALGLVFRRTLFKGQSEPLLLELPPYRLPSIRTVIKEVYLNCKDFVKTAGTIILVLSVVIWFLSSYPKADEKVSELKPTDQQSIQGTDVSQPPSPLAVDEIADQVEPGDGGTLENSLIGRAGRLIEPVLEPLGFDWKVGITILSSFVAREVAVSTLAILYRCPGCDEEEDAGFSGLIKKIKADKKPDGTPVWTLLTGLSLMIFYAFACQCMSTLAVVKRETGSYKWPVFMFIYMSIFAYLAALVVYQGGRALGLS